MNIFNNPGLLSFLFLLLVLVLFLAGIVYLIYKIYKKDLGKSTPIQYTSEYKKADSKITNGILDLQSVSTHQDLRLTLNNIEDGLSFFKYNNLSYNGKTPDEVLELLKKHSETKLMQIYEDLEHDIKDLNPDEQERLLELEDYELGEYLEFKKARIQRRKELQEQIQQEREREKVLNQLLKRDEEHFQEQKLIQIYKEAMKKR